MSNFKIKKNYDIKVSSNICDYLDPEFCYIPISNNYELLVNIKQKVLKNQPIIKSSDNYIVSSPISGEIIAIEQVNTIDGKLSALVIKNDFKEKIINTKGVNSDFTKYNNLDLNNIMKTCGVTYYDSNDGFFSFKNNKPKYLLINSVENEPYVANYSLLLSNKLEEILEAADNISRLLQIDEVYLAVNDCETDIINNIYDMLGTFANFKLKLVSNNYPADIMKVLPTNVNLKDVLTLNLTTLLAINTTFKKERNVTSKLITITGDLVDKPKVVSVKLGSNIKEVIDNNFKIKESDHKVYVANGLLSGIQIESLDLIVTANLSSIIIMEANTYIEKDCIDCGACLKVCPIKNNVKTIHENPNKKSSIKQIGDCTNCNACTYICPASRNFNSTFSIGQKKNNKIVIHDDNSIQKINYRLLIALLPLVIFGFYKNGVIVYQKDFVTLLGMIKPLFIPGSAFIIGYVIAYLVNKFYYHKEGGVLANYHLPLQALIVGMAVPIRVNTIYFLIIITIIFTLYFRFFYKKKFTLNLIALTTLFIVLVTYFTGQYTSFNQIYLNYYELSTSLNPSIIRLLIGYNYGGIAATSLLLITIGYLYLSSSLSYKKEIPLYTLLFYSLFVCISLIFNLEYSLFIRNMMSSSFIFILVFISSDSKSSPFNTIGMIVYSFLIALLSFIIGLYFYEISLLISVTVISSITILLNKIFKKTKF